jgi:hypothetical protein
MNTRCLSKVMPLLLSLLSLVIAAADTIEYA